LRTKHPPNVAIDILSHIYTVEVTESEPFSSLVWPDHRRGYAFTSLWLSLPID